MMTTGLVTAWPKDRPSFRTVIISRGPHTTLASAYVARLAAGM